MSEKITCQICGEQTHFIPAHLRDKHPEISAEEYKERYPIAPMASEAMLKKIEERKMSQAKQLMNKTEETEKPMATELPKGKALLDELFGMNGDKSLLNSQGRSIPVSRLDRHAEGVDEEMIPDIDDDFVFDGDLVKTIMIGIEMNIPVYLWGYHGSGKTSMFEQVCARTNRQMIRVNHSGNTEESHILGQVHANEKETYFGPGPLPMAMRYGWVYVADEYDYADPSVLAVYQSVLEGKPLLIKEAEANSEWRHVRPHPNFRLCATGNTNGQGDETGQYMGTAIGNAANYSRFGIVKHVHYPDAEKEKQVLLKKSKQRLMNAQITEQDAGLLIDFATAIRKGHDKGDIGNTVGPRELINAAVLGVRFVDFRKGLELAFINRLNENDRHKASEIAQRYFGDEAA